MVLRLGMIFCALVFLLALAGLTYHLIVGHNIVLGI